VTGSVFWFICVREANPAALPVAVASQASFNRQATNAIAGLKKSRHGIGDLLPRPVGKAIIDHLLCDGSAVSRTAFPQLFAEIGTEWGAGDGTTTFNLPTLNGVALPIPAEVPPQTIDPGGTVNGGGGSTPTTPGTTGGGGGGTTTGGREPRNQYEQER